MQSVRREVEGEEVLVQQWEPKGKARGGLLLVHGFNACTQEFGTAPAKWAAAGFHVLAFDQRGFGDSKGESSYTDRERFGADVDAATGWLREATGDLPIGVVGHSFGAAMLLDRLRGESPFAAAALAHPVLSLWAGLRSWQRPAMGLVGRLSERRASKGKPHLNVARNSNYRRLFEDPDRAAESWADARYLSTHVNAGMFATARSMDPLAWAAEVTLPTLGILGPKDRLIPYSDSLQVCRALSGPVDLIEHRGGHACFRDLDGQFVAERTAAWFAERFAEAA